MTRQAYGSYAHLNAALKLNDGFTGEPVESGAIFALDGVRCTPVEKDEGIFAFTDYADPSLPHVMRIMCAGYLDLIVPMLPVLQSSNLADVVQVIALHPDMNYRYPSDRTLLIGRVVPAINMNVADVVVAVDVAGRRGATRPGADGRYRLPIGDLDGDTATAILEFIDDGRVRAKRSVLVTKGHPAIVDDVTLTT